MPKRHGRDFESNLHATRARLGAQPLHTVPAPTTVPPHRHHASEIDYTAGGLLSAEEVQSALEEHDEEKLARDGSQTMLGNLDFNTFKIYNLGALNFDTDTVVAAVDGGLQWADAAGIERLVMRADGVDMPVGGVYLKVKNASGGTISGRTPCVADSADGNLLTIVPADITMAVNDRAAVVLTMQNIEDGASGWVCRLGYVGGLDFSSFTAGLQLYVDGTGTMSGAVPQKGCSARIRMGQVIDPSNPGSMWVDPDWRPDLDELANVAIGEYAEKQHFDVVMWLPRPDGEPCDAWREVPAARWPVVDLTIGGEVGPKEVVWLVRANADDVEVQLPSIQDATHDNRNRWVRIKKIQGAHKVRVLPHTGQTIDGRDSVTLYKVGEVLDVQAVSEGATRWEIQ